MTGIIPIDKGENMTSFKAVAAVRRITGEKKCGHSGTLDPMATGVLPVAIGGATRFIELFCDHTKEYRATFKTGLTTDTLDIWGTVTETFSKTASLEEIKSVLPGFCGKIMQTPPMFSALKKDGVRLYELARRGETVERESRECEITKLFVSEAENGEFELFVKCSAGTYIRSLIGDIGVALNTGAVMTSLRRTRACSVDISQCVSLDALKEHIERGTLDEIMIPVEKMLGLYPAVNVTEAQGVRFKNGGGLSRQRFSCEGLSGFVRVYSNGKFLGIGEILNDCEDMKMKRLYSEI